MNTIDRPPIEPATNGQGSSEPYEELLRAFFRSEMPEPWPAAPPREARAEDRILITSRLEPSADGRGYLRYTRAKSRLALAASVVILLVSSWLLAGALRDGGKPGNNSQVVPGTNTAHPQPETMPPKHSR